MKFCLFCWTNKMDTWLSSLDPKMEAMWGRLIEAIQWTWGQMTLLSALILIMILAIIGLTWLQLADRKKYMSRAYWRGFRDGKKD